MILTKIIKFKDKFYDDIINGSKTQTMRMPRSRIDVNPGDQVIGVFKNKRDVLLQIRKTGYKYFKSINDHDAELEGFDNAEELKKELLEIYKDYQIIDNNRFYYYRFEFLEVL